MRTANDSTATNWSRSLIVRLQNDEVRPPRVPAGPPVPPRLTCTNFAATDSVPVSLSVGEGDMSASRARRRRSINRSRDHRRGWRRRRAGGPLNLRKACVSGSNSRRLNQESAYVPSRPTLPTAWHRT